MGVLLTGNSYSTNDQVTATNLNASINSATFTSSAVDGVTTDLSGGAIVVRDSGITTAKVADSAITTAKVASATSTTTGITFPKIQWINNLKVIGNASGSLAAPSEMDVLDDDTMATASATTLATSESIKEYVNSNGITQTSGSAPYYGCRAFGAFDGTATTPITPIASGNIASIVRDSTGTYTVTLTTSMEDTNYCVIVNETHHVTVTYETSISVTILTSSSFRLQTGGAAGLFNSPYIAFQVIA